MNLKKRNAGLSLIEAVLVLAAVSAIIATSLTVYRQSELRANSILIGQQVQGVSNRVRDYYYRAPDYKTPPLNNTLAIKETLIPRDMLSAGSGIRAAANSKVTLSSTIDSYIIKVDVLGANCAPIADVTFPSFYRISAAPAATGASQDLQNLEGPTGRLSPTAKADLCGAPDQVTTMTFYSR